jgi:hypothetical protein
MNAPVFAGLESLSGLSWTILAIGIVFGCFAFVLGRRFFTPRPGEPPPAEKPPEDVFVEGSTMERRAAPRRRGNSGEVFLAEASDKEKLPAWVLDRSVGGLCLSVDAPLPVGSVWQVRPRTAPETTPWTPVEVRTCRPDKGEWEVGCRFVKTPQFNVMLLFG